MPMVRSNGSGNRCGPFCEGTPMRMTSPSRTAPRQRSASIAIFAVVVASVALAAAPAAVSPVAAQEPEAHSDWIPFVGEVPMGCTAALGSGSTFCRTHHNGWAIDINMDFGMPIYAAGPGVVGWIEGDCDPNGGDGSCNNAAGNYVAVDHGDHFSRYIHLASFGSEFEIGDPITGGQLIGYAGNSGTSGNGRAHLHYDEIAQPISITQRIFFGPMLACHGDTAVQYPDILGKTDWQELPWGTLLRNDGYECLGGITATPPPPPPPLDPSPGGSVGLAMGDFDGDGFADLAIGIAGENIRAKEDAGTAAVVYGNTTGLGDTEALRQGKTLKGKAEAGDMLGAAVAAGDFDCDDKDDLAIGAPGEDLGGLVDAGAVSVSYGGGKDVNNRATMIYQGKWGLPGPLEAGDLTGSALAVGDFNNDGCDDLAIGAPGEDVGSLVNTGAVMVLYGSPNGFSAESASEPLLYQDGGLAGFTEASDFVGAALAAGDFNCDGHDDLAIGVPGESIDGKNNAGAVSLIFGGADGLRHDPVTLYQSEGIAGNLESGDRVGTALAAGNFNDDDCDDLAVGAPREDLGGGNDAGAVSVSFGSPEGLIIGTVHFQSEGGLGETIEADDNVGAALVAIDLNCDGVDDLAVGAPGESIAGIKNTGWVGIMAGSPSGLGTSLASLFQTRGGLPGKDEVGDALGTTLAAGDTNGDGCEDLAIGVPGEGIRSRAKAGRVIVVLGGPNGPSGTTNWYQSKNLPGSSESGDLLGGPGIWTLLGLSLQ